MLVPFVLPGERARVEPRTAPHAKLLELIEPSSERVAAPCPLFGVCGGCQYQHAPYEYQLARKVEILREQLRRVGKLKWEGEVQVVSGPPLAYRNRAQFHLTHGRIGYMAAGTNQLAPVDGECPIASPRVNQGLEVLRRQMRDPRFPRFVRSIEVFTNEAEIQFNVLESDKPVARWFYEQCGSVAALEYPTEYGQFRVSPRSFFQVNRFLIEKLVQAALPGDGAGTAVDLYSGVGLFTVPLAGRFRSVTAVEAGVSAARDLEFNITRAGMAVEIYNRRVEEFLANLPAAPDFVLADPPRAGLGHTAVQHLERLKPPGLTIVSCDPATLARDLAGLSSYRIERLILVDLFPQTFHLESVAVLGRR
jgi:23S rRNA (uracil1939-C5)-methyltransferase